MLKREQVEAIIHNPMNADWSHVLQLADDWHDIDTCAACAAMFPFHQLALFKENER